MGKLWTWGELGFGCQHIIGGISFDTKGPPLHGDSYCVGTSNTEVTIRNTIPTYYRTITIDYCHDLLDSAIVPRYTMTVKRQQKGFS